MTCMKRMSEMDTKEILEFITTAPYSELITGTTEDECENEDA